MRLCRFIKACLRLDLFNRNRAKFLNFLDNLLIQMFENIFE